jgi:L-lactate dehydrogenase complex protein LldG
VSARDDILAGIREALGPTRRPPVTVDRAYRARPASAPARRRTEVLDLFVERVEDYRATVTRCAATDVDEAVAVALGASTRVAIPDRLWLDVPRAVVDRGSLTADELDEIDGVVTRAALGIAETGTVVLDHGPGQGRRILSLVPDLHVCVLEADRVVPAVVDAVAALDPDRPQTWISGPSATSDIELSRVEGVHGPRRLHIVLVED